MEHGQIHGVDCDSDSMNLFVPSVNPATCTKLARIRIFRCAFENG